MVIIFAFNSHLLIQYKLFLFLTIIGYILFPLITKMIKSRSYSSMVTKATSTERPNIANKFNNHKQQTVHILGNPFTNPYPLRFPKNFMKKQTSMNMLLQTEEIDRKPYRRADPNANRASMMEVSTPRRQLRSGDFSYLAYESPSKPIHQREFQDIGTIRNRRRPNQAQYNSVSMLASINSNIENIGPDKFVKATEKKHFKPIGQIKKQMQWADDKTNNKERFQMKYRKAGRQCLKEKNAPQASYSSIHLKFASFK